MVRTPYTLIVPHYRTYVKRNFTRGCCPDNYTKFSLYFAQTSLRKIKILCNSRVFLAVVGPRYVCHPLISSSAPSVSKKDASHRTATRARCPRTLRVAKEGGRREDHTTKMTYCQIWQYVIFTKIPMYPYTYSTLITGGSPLSTPSVSAHRLIYASSARSLSDTLISAPIGENAIRLYSSLTCSLIS